MVVVGRASLDIYNVVCATLSTKKICFFLVLTWYILSIYTHISAASRSRARLTSTRRLFLRVSSSFSSSSYSVVLLSCFPLLLLEHPPPHAKTLWKRCSKNKKEKKKILSRGVLLLFLRQLFQRFHLRHFLLHQFIFLRCGRKSGQNAFKIFRERERKKSQGGEARECQQGESAHQK